MIGIKRNRGTKLSKKKKKRKELKEKLEKTENSPFLSSYHQQNMAQLVQKIFGKGGKTDEELKELQKKYNIKFEETDVSPYNVFEKDFSQIVDKKWEVNPSAVKEFPRNIDGWTIPILSEEESGKLIKLTEGIQYGPCGYPKHYRSNSRIIVNDPKLADLLYSRIKKIAPAKVEKSGLRWDICGLNERFRYCRYIKGQHFGTHCDAKFTRRSDEMSFYTVNIYLNEHIKEFTGGRTIFYDYNESGGYGAIYDIKPKPGLALIFNHTTQSYLHGGEKLESGVKYIMRTDIMYRKYDAHKAKKEEEKQKAIQELKEKQAIAKHKQYINEQREKKLTASPPAATGTTGTTGITADDQVTTEKKQDDDDDGDGDVDIDRVNESKDDAEILAATPVAASGDENGGDGNGNGSGSGSGSGIEMEIDATTATEDGVERGRTNEIENKNENETGGETVGSDVVVVDNNGQSNETYEMNSENKDESALAAATTVTNDNVQDENQDIAPNQTENESQATATANENDNENTNGNVDNVDGNGNDDQEYVVVDGQPEEAPISNPDD